LQKVKKKRGVNKLSFGQISQLNKWIIFFMKSGILLKHCSNLCTWICSNSFPLPSPFSHKPFFCIPWRIIIKGACALEWIKIAVSL